MRSFRPLPVECRIYMEKTLNGIWLSLGLLAGLSAPADEDALIGGMAFVDRGHPPSYRPLAEDEALVHFGQSVFDSQWVAAGVSDSAGRTGVGPLFNANSCTACHAEGERGQGPVGSGPVPVSLVIQLQNGAPDAGPEPGGDPVYGRVFNTFALNGVPVEGAVTVRYTETAGYYYPYGGRWSLRVPHYRLTGLPYGPLSPTTVIKPRLAPALFGVGLLEAVPEIAITEPAADRVKDNAFGTPVWHTRHDLRLLGRLGWQGDAVSVRDQATSAFSREMGITSTDRPADDCTPVETACRAQPSGGSPEVSEELLGAVVAFVRSLAVPDSPAAAPRNSPEAGLFSSIGCAACHRPRLPVQVADSGGTRIAGVIAAYTDLKLHDLGSEMADENASGEKVRSLWRTAPLWGLGYRLKIEAHPTYLHDGRARSAEEAILWHSGEASRAKYNFAKLGPRDRESFVRWLETL